MEHSKYLNSFKMREDNLGVGQQHQTSLQLRAEPSAPPALRRNETKMEALVAIKWDKEREGQVCEKATEDLQIQFCLFCLCD